MISPFSLGFFAASWGGADGFHRPWGTSGGQTFTARRVNLGIQQLKVFGKKRGGWFKPKHLIFAAICGIFFPFRAEKVSFGQAKMRGKVFLYCKLCHRDKCSANIVGNSWVRRRWEMCGECGELWRKCLFASWWLEMEPFVDLNLSNPFSTESKLHVWDFYVW